MRDISLKQKFAFEIVSFIKLQSEIYIDTAIFLELHLNTDPSLSCLVKAQFLKLLEKVKFLKCLSLSKLPIVRYMIFKLYRFLLKHFLL